MTEIKTPNLDNVDWKSIKRGVKPSTQRWGNGQLEMNEKELDYLIDCCNKDLLAMVSETNAKLLFIFGRTLKRTAYLNEIEINMLNTYNSTIQKNTKVQGPIYSYKINLPNEFINKKADELMPEGMVVQRILTELGINHYSIPYGESRTIERNHGSKVLNYAYIKDYKIGAMIVQTKRSVIGFKIANDGQQTKIRPIKIKECSQLIERIKKGVIEFRKGKENDELIAFETQKEEDKELEAKI